MKPIQFAAKYDGVREYTRHAQIRNGFVYVTDATKLIIFPQVDVFGSALFEPTETLYFSLSAWTTLKMHSAKNIIREGGALLSNGLSLVLNTEIDGSYPGFDTVLPDVARYGDVGVPFIGVDISALSDLAKCFGKVRSEGFYMVFLGTDKIIRLRHIDAPDLTAYIMPTCINDPILY